MKKVRVGAGSAGWPDLADSAWDVAEHGNVDYMGFDHLAELTMAILQRQKARDPKRGYIPDVIPLMKGLLPIWKKKDKHFKMIDNGGGANPGQCAEAVLQAAKDLNLGGIKVGVITGDDISLAKLDQLSAQGFKFRNLDTGEEDLSRIRSKLLSAYVYTGSDQIIEALGAGADLVLTGRASDNSLFVAPYMHAMGWKFEDAYWDRIGAAIIAGHLLECGGWSAGISSNAWEDVPEPWHPSMPIGEMDENGDVDFSITPTSGGIMTELTLKEHLLYEVHDPHNYLMPDGIGDISTIKLKQTGKNRVRMTKFGDVPRGKARPEKLKLCIAYQDGYISEYTAVLSGPKIFKQVEKVTQYVHKRLERSGLKPREVSIQLIGYNSLHGPTVPPPSPGYEPNEIGFHVAFKCNTMAEARECRVQAGSLSWSAAAVGNAFSNAPADREVYAMWPTLIPRDQVPMNLEIKEVK